MNRLGGLDQRVTWANDHGLSWADHVRLSSRIIASVPLDFASENRVGEFSLDDDADLGAWVVMNWKHPSRHNRHPAEGQFGICDADRCGPAQDLAGDGHWRGSFWSSVLGIRNRRASPPHHGHAAKKSRDD